MTVRIRRASATRGHRHLIRREPDLPPGRFVGTGVSLLRGAGAPAISAEAFVFLLGTGAGRFGGHAISGFELAFSVPRSVSIAWALAGDATREIIHAAHLTAIDHTLGYAERAVFAGRGGDGRRIAGVIGAAFDQWENRTGDPHLHTRVVVPTRVQLEGGDWGVIDGEGLGEELAALDELHEGILSDVLAARIGWAFVPHPRLRCDIPRFEVDGVDPLLIRAFTRHVPARGTGAPGRHRTLQQLTGDWLDRARPYVADPQGWVDRLGARPLAPAVRGRDVDDAAVDAIARRCMAAVYGRRGEVTAARLAAEARRQLRTERFAGPVDRIAVADRVLRVVARRAADAA